MANPHRGEVALGALTLRFSINAICEAEAASGLNLLSLLGKLDGGDAPTMNEARVMLWAGLRDKQPDIDLEAAGDFLQSQGVAPSMKAVGEALRVAFVKTDDAEEEPARKNG